MEGAVSETRSEIESQLIGVEFSEVSKKINGEGSVRSGELKYVEIFEFKITEFKLFELSFYF